MALSNKAPRLTPCVNAFAVLHLASVANKPAFKNELILYLTYMYKYAHFVGKTYNCMYTYFYMYTYVCSRI